MSTEYEVRCLDHYDEEEWTGAGWVSSHCTDDEPVHFWDVDDADL